MSKTVNMVMTEPVTGAAELMDRDGYLILEGLFSEAEIRPISDEVDRIIEDKVSYLPAKELVYEPDSNPRRLRNAFRLHFYNQLFLDFAKSPKLLEPLEEILGNKLRLYGSQIFAKPALVGTVVPQHQDMPYWPFDPPEMISAWIALDDSTIENGCVRFATGSHKLGMLPHEKTAVTGNSLGLIKSAKVDALPERAMEIKRGTVVLHHSLAVHRSEPNRSGRARRGLIYVYMSQNVQVTDPSKLNGPEVFPEVS